MKKITLITAMLTMSNLLSAQWIQQNPYYPQNGHALKDVFFIDQEQGWTVGDIESLFTIDGGNNWDWNVSLPPQNLHSVFFVDNLNGWVCGETGIWYTNDGGIGITGTWEQQLDMSNNPTTCSKLFFIDTLTGWYFATYSGSFPGCEIYKTIDGGSTWIQKFGPNVGELYDMTFSDNLNGWVVGFLFTGNSILHSNDGGETWEEMTSAPTDIGLNSVFFVDSLNGWTTGYSHYYPFHSFIYHTDNGGEIWVVQHDTLTSSLLNDITFSDLNNGWAVGRDGTILHTSNGGQNWEYQESGTTAGLNSVCFTDENHGWICGDSAIILHTDNGGIVGILENSISISKLTIFPNPANEIATITFKLEQKEVITLSILNIRGQEIKQISLGEKEKGQVDIDCSNFSPGFYFVNLRIDKGVLTKQLIME